VNSTVPNSTVAGSASYDELVTVATVGLSRRPLPFMPGDGAVAGAGAAAGEGAGEAAADDPADVLLEAAARLAVARRAGVLPAAGVTAPPPVPADPVPELPARAGYLLRRAASDAELLADLLMMTAQAGYRAPAPLLPVLLDAAVRTAALRPAVTAAIGIRGRWLAAQRGEWGRAADPSDAPATDDPRAWETGSRAQRAGYLAALRDSEPAIARELLITSWPRESAEERAHLLGVLSRGLSPDDEKLLEAALDDRAASVRATARQLLSALPGSAFNQRAMQRAACVLRLRSQGARRWLEAALPDGPVPDGAASTGAAASGGPFAPAGLARDGIGSGIPGPGIGAGAWLLTQLIAAVPLDAWASRWGLSAGELVTLPFEGSLRVEVFAGWRLAAIRQRHAGWAAALLSGPAPLLAPGRPEAAWPGNHELAAVLDPGTRAALAPDVITRIAKEANAAAGKKAGNSAVTTVIAQLTAWPGPWPEAIADLIVGMAASNISAQGAARMLHGLLARAARNLPVAGPRDYAAEFTQLTQSPDCAYPWVDVLRRTADTLSLRRAFHAALAGQP
jgi:hypothetical protein